MIKDTVRTNRGRYIGGSDIPALMGRSKFKSIDQLYLEYSTNIFQFRDSPYTLYGTYMESIIREYANGILNLNCKPDCVINDDLRIRCNTDGYDPDNKVILEIKTNTRGIKNTFDYELQMQLYMWAFNVNKAYLVTYKRPKDFYNGLGVDWEPEQEYFNLDFNSDNIEIKEIKRADKLILEILNNIKIFWNKIDDLREKRNNG